jgi:hypothetical protein
MRTYLGRQLHARVAEPTNPGVRETSRPQSSTFSAACACGFVSVPACINPRAAVIDLKTYSFPILPPFRDWAPIASHGFYGCGPADASIFEAGCDKSRCRAINSQTTTTPAPTTPATIFCKITLCVAPLNYLYLTLTIPTVLVKKYTEDHEWIELDSDGKTGATNSHSAFSTSVLMTEQAR